MTVLSQMLEKYDSTTAEGAANGLREVMQEIALAGLYRGVVVVFSKRRHFTAVSA
ncbi:hypothetical protein [Chlorobaculum limnaeum]|uniref:hypothetical protein n=1 Tax=Chlorobaculum limnaeum TaxID=274537 RepID=UPI000A5EAA4D|nr:hypothetical protein [Chlorobaculum limnaeum]